MKAKILAGLLTALLVVSAVLFPRGAVICVLFGLASFPGFFYIQRDYRSYRGLTMMPSETKEHWILNYGAMPGCLNCSDRIWVLFRNKLRDYSEAGDYDWGFDDNSRYDIIAWRRVG